MRSGGVFLIWLMVLSATLVTLGYDPADRNWVYVGIDIGFSVWWIALGWAGWFVQ